MSLSPSRTSAIIQFLTTDPELPYQPPVWLGDWSNGELYHHQTEVQRKAHDYILKQGDELSRYYGMERPDA